MLQKDSWAAAVVDELEQEPQDIKVDKYRISGFWDTPLDSILRNLGTRTVLFSGVNTDQCVLHSLTDANFLGYGCVLVEDCCATTSPDFCTEATVWNVKKCFGFVTDFREDIESPEEVTKRLRQLVLLPGFMCDKDLWTDMVPGLAALGHDPPRQRLRGFHARRHGAARARLLARALRAGRLLDGRLRLPRA